MGDNIDQDGDYSTGLIKKSQVRSIRTGQKGRTLNAEILAKRFKISIEMAKKTLLVTIQISTRVSDEPSLTRKYRTNDRMLRYARMQCDSFMVTMFATKDAKSLRGFTSCQVFATEFGHAFVVPIEDKRGSNIALSIKRHFKEKGVPLHLIYDQAR